MVALPHPRWQQLAIAILEKRVPIKSKIDPAHPFPLSGHMKQKDFIEGYLTWMENYMLLQGEYTKYSQRQDEESAYHCGIAMLAHHFREGHPARKESLHILDYFNNERAALPQLMAFLEQARDGDRPSNIEAGWLRQSEIQLRKLNQFMEFWIDLLGGEPRDPQAILQIQTECAMILSARTAEPEDTVEDVHERARQMINNPLYADDLHEVAQGLLEEYRAAQLVVREIIGGLRELQQEFSPPAAVRDR
jgi:hypothetical protein